MAVAGYIGMMAQKMETTIMGLYRVQGFGILAPYNGESIERNMENIMETGGI